MAGIVLKLQTAEITTGTALKTIAQLVAAANHRVLVKSFGFYFDGISPTAAPILCALNRQTTAGTMSALTLLKNNADDGETIQTTAQHTATVEPTAAAADLMSASAHPQDRWEWVAPTREDYIVVNGGDRLGFVTTAAAAVNCILRATIEE